MREAKKMTFASVAFSIVATLLLSGCKTLLFSGGVGNAVKNLKPAPDIAGRSIAGARLKATEEVAAALVAVDAGTGFTSYATSTDDRCYKGVNDLWIKDGYAYRCTVRWTRFYGMSGSFRTQMIGLEDLLGSNGWQLWRSGYPEYQPVTFRGTFASQDAACGPQRIAVFGYGDMVRSTCDPSKLPRVRSDGYEQGKLRLWIEYQERDQVPEHMMDFMQRVDIGGEYKQHDRKYNLYTKSNLQDVSARVREILELHPYAVSVTVEKIYFEN